MPTKDELQQQLEEAQRALQEANQRAEQIEAEKRELETAHATLSEVNTDLAEERDSLKEKAAENAGKLTFLFPKQKHDLSQPNQKSVTATDGVSQIPANCKGHVCAELFVPERDGITGDLKFKPFTQWWDVREWATFANSPGNFRVKQYINFPDGCKTIEQIEKEKKMQVLKPRLDALKSELAILKEAGMI